MCGIAGFYDVSSLSTGKEVLHRMGSALHHRGPDGLGIYASKGGLGLVHARLSIFDLSETGSQPMTSNCGRFVFVFNGEIYNFLELREQLKSFSIPFRGSSDTEVFLESIANFGLDKTLSKVRGMFAFALFDQHENTLTLARDRAGEKPLYYYIKDQCFIFGSELKALLAHPKVDRNVNHGGVKQFLSYGFIPTDSSILDNVNKVRPGTYLTISLNDIKKVDECVYWKHVQNMPKYTGSFDYAVKKLDSLLTSAIIEQSKADVNVGAFLSGGIDSSLVTAIMAKNSASQVQSFCIGFEDPNYNEATHAVKVAQHLGTSHNTLYVTDSMIQDIIPAMVSVYDEPLSDMSQLPTYLVSNFARKNITVALTGDGGDELFGGYNRYIWINKFNKVLSIFPYRLRYVISNLVTKIKPQYYEQVINLLPKSIRYNEFGLKAHKLARSFSSQDNFELYETTINQLTGLAIFSNFDSKLIKPVNSGFSQLSIPEQMMILDFLNYMREGVLTKVDRAAMANSLETRAPFLDKRIIEFSSTLSLDYKIKGVSGKQIVKSLLGNYLPNHITDRPKTGFSVPMAEWLRGPLKDWAYTCLFDNNTAFDGVIKKGAISILWEHHQLGKFNYQSQLWTLITYAQWYRKYIKDYR